jgi:large subunit ribosomal protein L25
MAEITLEAEVGRKTGSAESRRLRASGRVPAVVYGHGMDGVAVSVDGRELRHALSGATGTNQLLDLRFDGQRHLALARVLQRHPVRHTVVHVDFQVVGRDEVVSADVPVTLVGEARGVTLNSGIIEHVLVQMTVRATPGRIPDAIEVDITDLEVGGSIRVGDIRLPAGVETELDADEVVVLAATSAEGEAEAHEAAEAGDEAAAGTGDAGEGEA